MGHVRVKRAHASKYHYVTVTVHVNHAPGSSDGGLEAIQLKHIVNDGLASNLLASVLNNRIIQLNLVRSELVGVKKNAG